MSTNAWKKDNMKQYAFRISNSTGLPDILKIAADKAEISEVAYIRQAIIEKLQRDGYLKAGDQK